MGQQLVQQMLGVLAKMDWPKNERATEVGRKAFEIGMEKVDSYEDDPRILGAALRVLQTADSYPYACAGVAYILMAAAREADGSFAPAGLDAALEWLEKAQDLEPEIVEFNVLEAFLYIYAGRYDDARLVLDYLHENIPNRHYFLLKAEMTWWLAQGHISETLEWGQKTMAAAKNVPQRLGLLSIMADCYVHSNQVDKAIETYKEAIHFDAQNGRLWHELSLIYLNQERYDEASRLNTKALSLQPNLAEARNVEAILREKNKSKGLVDRLFNR